MVHFVCLFDFVRFGYLIDSFVLDFAAVDERPLHVLIVSCRWDRLQGPEVEVTATRRERTFGLLPVVVTNNTSIIKIIRVYS